jgi:hypothetical protein
MLSLATPLHAQDNVLDLRVEWRGDRKPLYQNFLYARTLAGGRLMVQGLILRLPGDNYDELAAGVGYRVLSWNGLAAYAIVGYGGGTDPIPVGGARVNSPFVHYYQPAVLVQRTQGRLTCSLFVQRYTPVDWKGTVQWLVDPLEVQYAIAGPVALGASLYAYRSEGGEWLTRLGPKLAFADTHGSTELRVSRVSTGGQAIQLRRVLVF